MNNKKNNQEENKDNNKKGILTFVKDKVNWQHWKTIALFLVVYDMVAIGISYFAGLWLRFDLSFSAIPAEYMDVYVRFIPIYIVICLIIFMGLNLYRSLWRFASYSELVHITLASGLASVLHIVITLVFYIRMPITYYVLGALLQYSMILGIRFVYRLFILIRNKFDAAAQESDVKNKSGRLVKNIMLIGAGSAGRMILRDINNTDHILGRIVCIVDDNPNKWNRYIDGVKIVGGRDSILENVDKYKINTIFLAIPSAPAVAKRDILNICKETECELKTLPGMYQFATGQLTASALRNVSVEELLGREPVNTNLEEVFEFIAGKTVLVTGGGGSIGSELCRQIAAHSPKKLIIFDIYENNAYDIQLELKDKYPELDLLALIGSVRDSRRIMNVFETYKPDVVYHAAAHKHVPLMEDSPCESIKNNVLGTYKTAYAAMLFGCKRFVLISTDKAVNPTNIMGASKRLCEMVIQSFDKKIKDGKAFEIPQIYEHEEMGGFGKEFIDNALKSAKTEFVAVRFGNVLGSNGSVIPIFKKQIEKGGPVTVTHPDIIRYFMTIPEAVSLVLEAGCHANGGEIFVLDMGSPVKIDQLARNLIRLSGLRPDIDIKIDYVGLRPGEKLYEEKLMEAEGLQKTMNDLIYIGRPLPFEPDVFFSDLCELTKFAYKNKEDKTKMKVEEIVGTYHPIQKERA